MVYQVRVAILSDHDGRGGEGDDEMWQIKQLKQSDHLQRQINLKIYSKGIFYDEDFHHI